ncbi:7076_t:CDS:1 [Paraglomus occultum]|uniref:7076_t:CDS:1 n=1 Tax=Paraglomus occultum TaxID=144539 RepID=A0A9N9BKV5_9GLOM|nr:7076_t:CDS:1 [Paraglomus occultum]
MNRAKSASVSKLTKLFASFYMGLGRRNVEETWEAYTQLRHSNIKLTRTKFRHVIKLIVEQPTRSRKFLNYLLDIYSDMKSRRIPLRKYDFNCILSFTTSFYPHMTLLDIEIVMAVLHLTESAKITPNHVSYNILVDIAAHLPSPAAEFLAERLPSGLQPNVKRLTSITHAYAMKNDLAGVVKMVETIMKEKMSIDVYVLNTVIWAFVGGNDLESGVMIYRTMINDEVGKAKRKKNNKFTPTLPTFHILLSACLSQQRWKLGILIYRDMKSLDVEPDIQLFNIILKHVVKALYLADSVNLKHKDTKQRKYKSENISQICQRQALKKGIRLLFDYFLNEIKHYENVKPDFKTHNLRLQAHLLLAEIKEANDVLRVMESASMPIDIYNTWLLRQLQINTRKQ